MKGLVKFYEGEVVENLDSEKKLRVKIRIAGIHDNLSDDELPWAYPLLLSGGSHKNMGTFVLPKKGEKIIVVETWTGMYFYLGGKCVMEGNGNVKEPKSYECGGKFDELPILVSEKVKIVADRNGNFGLYIGAENNETVVKVQENKTCIEAGGGSVKVEIDVSSGLVKIETVGNVEVKANGNLDIDGSYVKLHDRGLVMGYIDGVVLSKVFDALVNYLEGHVHPLGPGMTGPPAPPPSTVLAPFQTSGTDKTHNVNVVGGELP